MVVYWLVAYSQHASLSDTFLQTLPDLVTYATEGALFISAQLSTDAVSALRKVWLVVVAVVVVAVVVVVACGSSSSSSSSGL